MRDGFRDATDDYGFRDAADDVLSVSGEASEEQLSDYEVIEEGKPYREWCVPAETLRQLVAAIQPIKKS
jgi:hypothetical protein